MRENSATVSLPSNVDRKKSFRAIGLQVIAVAVVALIYLSYKGIAAAVAALVGGAAYLIPTFLLTWIVFTIVSARTAKQVAVVLFLGEFIKLLFCAAVIAVTIVCWPSLMWPTLVGFLGVQVGSWFAPVFNNKVGRRVDSI